MEDPGFQPKLDGQKEEEDNDTWEIVGKRRKIPSIAKPPIETVLPKSYGESSFYAASPNWSPIIAQSISECSFIHIGEEARAPNLITDTTNINNACRVHPDICERCHESVKLIVRVLIRQFKMMEKDLATILGVIVLLLRVKKVDLKDGDIVRESNFS